MLLVLPVTVLAHLAGQGAEPPPSWAAAVDALLAPWERADRPGCALGVIQGGKLTYARAVGAASLEHALPITTRTVFDLGSTSKQFTAAAIGLLSAEGRLGVEDSLMDWVPELAALGPSITLDHLLHHTSGLPDYIGLMLEAGVHTEDWTTPADALAALARVKALDFPPGTRFEYSNSNYFLLSLVGERVAGMPFQDLVRQRLFEPLGMADTLLFHDHTLVVPRRATAYRARAGGGFAVDMSDFEQLGDGAVQTTLEDLVRWERNFATREVGGEALQAFLHRTGQLADGTPIAYARGLVVDSFRGLRRVSHGGAWAGYRAELMRFPDQSTAIACLSNFAAADPTGLCERVAGLVLSENMTTER